MLSFTNANGSFAWDVARRCRTFALLIVVMFPSSCVPSTRSRPDMEATREQPAKPRVHRTAAAMAANEPLTGPGAPAPPPNPDQRLVEGRWHWNGTEWQWIPEQLEKKDSGFEWKR